MKRLVSTLVLCCVTFSITIGFASLSPRQVLAQDEPVNAAAQLQDTQGNSVGSVSFTQTGAKVLVVVQVHNLPPGFHGLAVHTTGQCDAAGAFASAGAHFDPGAAARPNQAGDLPMILVNSDGMGYMTTFTDRFKVADLMDADGSAVVIHANADSYGSDDGGDRTACGVVQVVTTSTAAEANLKAIQALPLDQLPAKVSRGENAERATFVLTLVALGGAQVTGQIASADAGQIGSVDKNGDLLVFTFTEITYNVSELEFPGGLKIGPQTIKLDPSQPSTLTTNLTTGEITRNFHWLQTATDVLYNGQPTVALGDTAKAQIAEIKDLGGNVYSVRLLTHWKSSIKLDTWTIAGTTLPGGEVQAAAEFDGTYMIDFNK